jgi:hypothetical protein
MLNNTLKWIQTYLQKLKSRVPKNTGALNKSISGEVNQEQGGISLEFKALEYFAYQDEGVNGTQINRGSQFSYKDKQPPTSAFRAYSNTLGGQFAIARSIREKGIPAKGFFKDEADNDLKDLPTAILEDVWDTFTNKK